MNKEGNVIIADDDRDILLSARAVLRKYFNVVALAESIQLLKERIQEDEYDVVLLDMNFRIGKSSGEDGLNCLKYIKSNFPEIQVVIVTAYADIGIAVKAIKNGAFDFIIKPWENKKLLATVQAALKLNMAKKEVAQLKLKQLMLTKAVEDKNKELISESKVMADLKEQISKVSQTDANILILGENGTGKEVVARIIHRNSFRNKQPFIKIDLGAIPDNLFESELFGHEKGAFTDAQEKKLGKIELANEGTLFLDEIGNLPIHLQSKLLSVLQNRKLTPLGGTNEIAINARIICATNMPLTQMIKENSFRQDLYYRINTVELTIPPLRERKRDIPLLAKQFLLGFRKKYNKQELRLNQESLKTLKGYSFPGNVRELEHIIERAVIMSSDNNIKFDYLINKTEPNSSLRKEYTIEQAEEQTIKSALIKHAGNISKAAKEIGMGRTTIYRKMKKYGL